MSWVHGFSVVLWKLCVRMVNADPVSIGKAISKKKFKMGLWDGSVGKALAEQA